MSVDPSPASATTQPEDGLPDDAQKALVFEHLRRREQIAAETKAQLDDRGRDARLSPLEAVDPKVLEVAEDEYYEAQGKRRYRTSDGRTLFLLPEEIAKRRRARSSRHRKAKTGFYGPGADPTRWWLNWGFNLGSVLLAAVVVYLILR